MSKKRSLLIRYTSMAALFLIAAATAGFAVWMLKDLDVMAKAMYNTGVDVLGTFVCAMLFLGCIGTRKSLMEESTRRFIVLIVLLSVSFYVNAWEWFTSGEAHLRTVNLVLNSLTKMLDFGLVYWFYRFVREMLGFKGKFAKWLEWGVRILIIPASLLIIWNFFRPICFTVDAAGVFQWLPHYWLVDLYMIVVAPLTIVQLFRCDAPVRQKIVALSFILIPIVHYGIAKGAHGYATQYGSALLAVILMYCVLFNDRSRRLAATQTELNTAEEIQHAMIPHIYPAFPDRKEFDLYGTMEPAKEVGGDFYDYFLIDQDHLCLVMADVSGKGIPAALFMMASKIILQSCAMLGNSAAEILNRTNEAICSNNQAQMFVTVWLGILEISTGKLTAVNAGHEYPALKRADGTFELYKDRHGFVLGGMEDMRYRECTLQMEKGDKLFLYTDGVTEAMDKSSALFGTDRMVAALNADPDAPAREILKNVRAAVNDFVNGAEQFDDLTMLCMEYRGQES